MSDHNREKEKKHENEDDIEHGRSHKVEVEPSHALFEAPDKQTDEKEDPSLQFRMNESETDNIINPSIFKPKNSAPSGELYMFANASHDSSKAFSSPARNKNPEWRRVVNKRASLIKAGSIVNFNRKKTPEEMDLEITRWGGRSSSTCTTGRRKVTTPNRTENHRKTTKFVAEKPVVKEKVKRKTIGQRVSGMGMRTVSFMKTTFAENNVLNYENLIKIDKRKEVIANQCEEPTWKLLWHVQGTVVPVIVRDMLFWLTLFSYISVRITFLYNQGEIETDWLLADNLGDQLKYLGGFVTFMLIFYVNQNHCRYYSLHNDAMVLMGRVCDMATLAKANLPIERARRINRYMNAAHVAMYTGLSKTYRKENFFDPLEQRFALLTRAERNRVTNEIDVNDMGPKAAFEIIAWIMCDIRYALGEGCIDTNEANMMREQVLQFRSTIAKIFVTCTLPIPFFYVHFLSLLSFCYLPLYAVVTGFEVGEIKSRSSWGAEFITFLVVVLQALFVIGLRVLGQQMGDPFGNDDIDYQITRYVNMILKGSNGILAAKRLNQPSVDIELALLQKMSSVGDAFDYETDEEVIQEPSMVSFHFPG